MILCKVSWGNYGEFILSVKKVEGKNKIALTVQQDDVDVNLILHDFQAYPMVFKNQSTGEQLPCYRDQDITHVLLADRNLGSIVEAPRETIGELKNRIQDVNNYNHHSNHFHLQSDQK